MKRTTYLFLAVTLAVSAACHRRASEDHAGVTCLNMLTPEEQEAGWQLLFDGSSLSGWKALGLDSIPGTCWQVEEGTIHKVAGKKATPLPGGEMPPSCDLMTVDTFRNFELTFEWKISPAGNSGIKYNVSEEMSVAGGSTHALGFEYQIIDDVNYPGKLSPSQHSAALYDLLPPVNAHPRPPGEWNKGRILLRGHHGEHWLNGTKVVSYELGTPLFDSLFRKSKYHKHPRFPEKRYGHIVLQDHADEVWFRHLKIRKLHE